jgi:origin recognition complex subunit 1
VNPLASINGKASVLSVEAYMAKHPGGKISRNSKDYGKSFICRRGCNTRTATYTEEFIWEDVYRGTQDDLQHLIERVQNETKATRKRRSDKRLVDDEDEFADEDGDEDGLRTPKKKRRKIATISTPQKPRTPSKLLTPSHKRYATRNLCH